MNKDEKNYYLKLGQRIQNMRVKAGLTQDEVAKKIYLSRGGVASIERGNQRIHSMTVHILSEIFSVSVNDLLCGSIPKIIKEEPKKPERHRYLFWETKDSLPKVSKRMTAEQAKEFFCGFYKAKKAEL